MSDERYFIGFVLGVIMLVTCAVVYAIHGHTRLQADLNTFEGATVQKVDLRQSMVIIQFTDGREIKAEAIEGFRVRATMIEGAE